MTTAVAITASAVATMLDTAARNLAAYAESLRTAAALPPDATDTDSRRQGAVSSTYLGLTDHVLPLLADVDAWLLARKPKTEPAPVAPAVPTLAEYETASRTAFPTLAAGVTFDASYAGFLASGLALTDWFALPKAERADWVRNAAPAATAQTAAATVRAVVKTEPAPKAKDAKRKSRKDVKTAGTGEYRELVAKCKAAGLPAKGTKAELTARLVKHTTPPAPKTAPAAAQVTKAPASLPNGTHKALAKKLGVDVGDLVDALTNLGLTLNVTTTAKAAA